MERGKTMISYFFESTLCLGIFCGYYSIFLKNETCHHFKRFYLLLSSLLALILPIIQIELVTTPISNYFLLDEINLADLEMTTLSTDWNWSATVLQVYLIICLAFFLRLIFHLLKIRKVISTGRIRPTASFTLVRTKSDLAPSSFLHYIFWKTNLPPRSSEEEIVLNHEIAHVRGWHTLDMLFLEILQALFWLNPIVYWYKRAVALNLEYLADRASAPEDHSSYNSLLASRTIESFGLAMENHFNRSFTIKRINMLNRKKEKTSQYRQLATVPIALALFTFISCENGLPESEQVNDILIQNEAIFDMADEIPMPEGGMQGLYQFVAENLKYPADARKKGIEGKVYVEFVITKTGGVSEVKVKEGIGYGCDEASVEVIQSFNKWTPGVKDGEKVNVRMVLPITFKLS